LRRQNLSPEGRAGWVFVYKRVEDERSEYASKIGIRAGTTHVERGVVCGLGSSDRPACASLDLEVNRQGWIGCGCQANPRTCFPAVVFEAWKRSLRPRSSRAGARPSRRGSGHAAS